MGKEGTGGPNCAGPSKEKTPEEERLPVVLKALSGRFECRFSSAFPIGAGLLVIRVMEPTAAPVSGALCTRIQSARERFANCGRRGGEEVVGISVFAWRLLG